MLTRYRGDKYYEIHVDDVILMMENITKNKDTYTSIFDNPFLAEYKRVHDLYGTVFTLSLFFRIDATGAFGVEIPAEDFEIGWTLDQMTDKFKAEWIANSDWIRFNFHSYSYDIRYNQGAGLLRNAGTDYVQVRSEVYRFAGVENWHQHYNKFHWLAGDSAHTNQVIAEGVNVWVCHPMHSQALPYYLTQSQSQEVFTKGTWYDTSNDTLFIVAAGVVERIFGYADSGVGEDMGMYEYLTKFAAGTEANWYKVSDYLTFETHEDMFIASPLGVVPEYAETARWCQDNGYAPKFFDKGLMLPWADPTF